MKTIALLALTVLLVACAQATPVEPATPPVTETPVPDMATPPVTAPVEVPVADEPAEEPVDEEPVTKDEEPVTETVDDEPEEEQTTQTNVFNAQTLANFDGREGRRAYIALDGIVYDVTGHPMWPNGLHRGSFQAGKDYSAQIPASHRRDMRYDELPKVGTYE
jgi:predicted heme/steroid binding protein